jgi:hypothetical protein
MICSRALLFVLAVLPSTVLCQTEAGTIPAGTPLVLTLDDHRPMRRGESIRASLLYPIYVDNKLLLDKGAIVTGAVVALRPDRGRRTRAVLGGDFTPFHKPVVRFTKIELPDGSTVPLASSEAADGAPIYRAIAPAHANGSFLHREFAAGLTVARSDVAIFLGPGKGDRLVQFIYSQIPYHPERIEKDTAWTVETTAPVHLPAQPALPVAAEPPTRKPHFWEPHPVVAQPPAKDSGWIVQAYLAGPLSSETSTGGQTITAVVAEPIYNPDHSIAVPQGATLTGSVTRARPARAFGKAGVLNFNFQQLVIPDAATQTVETRLTGADSAADIALSSEGAPKAKPQDKVSVPLFLALLAGRPLDQDHRATDSAHQLGKDGAGGAAGLGLVGTIVGLAGGSPNVAASIGYWGAARAVYYRWIARGQKIAFAKDTRIVVETTPRRSAAIKPATASAP